MNGSTTKGKRLMTLEEAAAFLHVPSKTLHAWRYKRTGPTAIKVGRHLRYRTEDIDAWLDEQSTRV